MSGSNGFDTSTSGSGYNYMSMLLSPSQAGSTANGTIPSLATNKNVLVDYAATLWDGGPSAVVTGDNFPLGDAFFYNTGQTCTIESTNETTSRYVYINNQPIGMLGGATGILPGIVEKLTDFEPKNFLEELVSLGTPTCQQVTLKVVDDQGNGSVETQYVATTDVQGMYDCYFEDEINPYGSNPCNQGFTNLNPKKKKQKKQSLNIFSIAVLVFIVVFVLINV
jgi:hypothetical protein